jgi:hypothetical protein
VTAFTSIHGEPNEQHQADDEQDVVDAEQQVLDAEHEVTGHGGRRVAEVEARLDGRRMRLRTSGRQVGDAHHDVGQGRGQPVDGMVPLRRPQSAWPAQDQRAAGVLGHAVGHARSRRQHRVDGQAAVGKDRLLPDHLEAFGLDLGDLEEPGRTSWAAAGSGGQAISTGQPQHSHGTTIR